VDKSKMSRKRTRCGERRCKDGAGPYRYRRSVREWIS
jgi:hypothetical protein